MCLRTHERACSCEESSGHLGFFASQLSFGSIGRHHETQKYVEDLARFFQKVDASKIWVAVLVLLGQICVAKKWVMNSISCWIFLEIGIFSVGKRIRKEKPSCYSSLIGAHLRSQKVRYGCGITLNIFQEFSANWNFWNLPKLERAKSKLLSESYWGISQEPKSASWVIYHVKFLNNFPRIGLEN